MKRNVLSLIIALALCLNICPVQALAAGDELEGGEVSLTEDRTLSSPFEVSSPFVFKTNEFTFTGSNSTAILVTGTGRLELSGNIVSKNGAGVEVQSGCSLTTMPGTNITGTTYAVEIASGATAQLASGTYIGKYAAIHAEDNNFDFAGLLAEGCAYFDGNGDPILPADMAKVRKVTVGECTEHASKRYEADTDSPTHTWTCDHCKTGKTEPCTFSFNENETGTCDQSCGNVLAITVTESALADLVYDGAVKPGDTAVTVTLNGNTTLRKDTDYTAAYQIDQNAEAITVTVTGITFNGTFTQTYTVNRSQKVLVWDTTTKPAPVSVDYDGSPVEASDLPPVKINIQSSDNLRGDLRYSYKKTSGSTYTDGLPTDAGTYDVIVSLPKTGNLEAAVSDPITLTINKIDPVTTTPAAKTLTFNRAPQELVTAGTLKDVAVRDGVKVLFSTSQAGPYSETIPAGTNAGNYEVWYKVEESENYIGKGGKVSGVMIQRKTITPRITVTEPSYVYDGAKKSPTITVEDVDGPVVIDPSQYEVTWTDKDNNPVTELRTEGKYTATIKSVDTGNYTFNEQRTVEITPAVQNALKITNKPAHVYYGDSFTLDTTGGTGDGTVTWSVTGSATIQNTGKITVTGTGSVTVKAERTVENYGAVNDTWTFIVEPKPVTAVVTVTAKDYDGNTNATVTAKVKDSDLVNASDSFALNGLTGTYDTANAGTGKTVTLDDTLATKKDGSGKYAVSYPATATGDINPRNVTVSVTLSGNDLKTDAGGYYYIYDGTAKEPKVTVTYTDNGSSKTIPAGEYTVSYTNNKNVGTASVTVTAKTDGNYDFTGSQSFEIRKGSAQVIQYPQAKVLTFVGLGQEQELVTGGTVTGGHFEYSVDSGAWGAAIPKKDQAGTYVVSYKVVGDDNHADDTTTGSVTVTIQPREIVSPVITVSGTYTYDGSEQKPTKSYVTVVDGATTIPNTEYTLAYRDNVNAGTATVIVVNANGGNYIVNGEQTFTIRKANITAITAPTDLQNPYNGTEQELVKAGAATGGTMVYSLTQDGEYSTAIPTGKAVSSYTVYYKVLGDSNHNDSASASMNASIIVNTVTNPTIQVEPSQVTFTGQKQEPTVTIRDDKGFMIDSGEYTVAYAHKDGGSADLIRVGKYALTITGTGSNYSFTATAAFEILPAEQTPLTITGTREKVCYGDTIQLGTEGGSKGGTVTWAVDNSTIANITADGLLKITGVGSVKVTATSAATGYTDQTATWALYADKKPVTAVVTAVADQTYTGAASVTTTVTAKLQNGDLIGTDDITITLNGTFDDPNAGTNKRVRVDSTNPNFGSSTGHANYNITYPVETTGTILKAAVTNITDPGIRTGLEYTGSPMALVTAGFSSQGTVEYSRDNNDYSAALPSETGAGSYDIWYRVKGDNNHKDTAGTKLGKATINPQTVSPTIVLTPTSVPYDGGAHRPAVVVKDKNQLVIPENEYTITWDPTTDWIEARDYTVKISGKTGGNYNITGTHTAKFTISQKEQTPLTITGQPSRVQYGDASFKLTATGGSGTGAVTWASSPAGVVSVDASGWVTVLKSGPVTITATRAADANYGEVSTTWAFTVEQKPVSSPAVTLTGADDLKFTGTPHTPSVAVVVEGKTLSKDVDYTAEYSNNTNAGTATVTVKSKGSCDYDFSGTATFAIGKGQAAYSTEPQKRTDLTYTGGDQELVTAGSTTNNIGTVVYSLTQDSGYSTTIPTGINADDYTVYYKVEGTDNYTGIPEKSVTVTIAKATPVVTTKPTTSGTSGQKLSDITLNGGEVTLNGTRVEGTFAWKDDGETMAVAETSYDVTFTPNAEYEANYTTATCKVIAVPAPVSDGEGGSSTPSADTPSADISTTPATNEVSMSMPASVKNGAANAALSTADGTKLVKAAAASQSPNVVIKPKITEDVTKAEVSIPASTVKQITDETSADLTVSTPIADTTISREALDTLGQAGGTVGVAAEQTDQGVTVTLTADGKQVDSVPGGLTVTVPVEETKPGTVAVLVHEDGTRETIRKSVAGDGKVNIPLDGSATVEIVDNSKAFDDVSEDNWASDAVAFASAHELFNGTSETTFSPEQDASRGMLATVLYNLEGRPEQDVTMQDLDSGYSDVNGDAWYAEGVAWAAKNGIVNGYGDGQFGPDDSITREQLAVMLWKYAGSPEAGDQPLGFTDVDQANEYAREALRWAVEKGVLNGCGNGRLAPGETATRAEAAQMLKNFMERA